MKSEKRIKSPQIAARFSPLSSHYTRKKNPTALRIMWYSATPTCVEDLARWLSLSSAPHVGRVAVGSRRGAMHVHYVCLCVCVLLTCRRRREGGGEESEGENVSVHAIWNKPGLGSHEGGGTVNPRELFFFFKKKHIFWCLLGGMSGRVAKLKDDCANVSPVAKWSF